MIYFDSVKLMYYNKIIYFYKTAYEIVNDVIQCTIIVILNYYLDTETLIALVAQFTKQDNHYLDILIPTDLNMYTKIIK